VEQRADGDDFRFVRYPLLLSEPDGEEPGSDGMVEEKQVGILSGKVHCTADERRVDHGDATQDSGPHLHDRRFDCWLHCDPAENPGIRVAQVTAGTRCYTHGRGAWCIT